MIVSQSSQSFPPYEMLHQEEPSLKTEVVRVREKTRRLERLYDNTVKQAWNADEVLEGLIEEHGGIHIRPEHQEAIGELFTILLWGELAAWNVAADLARELPDIDAKMAASGQTFDEARHFHVLRQYLLRAGVPLPPINPLGRRVLTRLMRTPSILQKLAGMQLLVENLALAIFKRVAEAGIDPVLSALLPFLERDESRHVALGVIYLPRLLPQASVVQRAQLWAFTAEMFFLTVAQGRRLDRHFITLGIDHRQVALLSFKLHDQMRQQIIANADLTPGQRLPGLHGLTKAQHRLIVDFLHPENKDEMSGTHRTSLRIFDRAVGVVERMLN